MPSQLSVVVVPPEDSIWNSVELRLLVDGQDLIGPVFDKGPAEDPDRLLGPAGSLSATDEPHEVKLAEADCTEGCCGAIYVHVRRDGNEVVWDRWRNPDVKAVALPVVRFDAGQYEAELARADSDRSWEWPGRTVARLVRAKLREDPALLGRWDSGLGFVHSQPDKREQVDVSFFSPPMTIVRDAWEAGRPIAWRQFILHVTVAPDEPAEAQAARIVDGLRDDDPRVTAEICGGSNP